jgi:general secretion pathway protein J
MIGQWHHAGCRRDRGFTLLEVLAALAILGLILAALSAGLRFGQQALLTQEHDTGAANQLGPVDLTLRTLIARAWPGAGGGNAEFIGGSRTLTFRTIMPESLSEVRIRDADVTIGVDAEHRLYLAWLPWYHNWIVPKPLPKRVALLANVDHVEFSYWDPSLQLPPGGWVTAWAGTSAPKLLRVRLVFTKDSGLHWPEIIAATERDRWEF